MFPFLKSVARAYAGRYGDLSGFCFVFPGKRAGTFFLKHLRKEASGTALAPGVMTISEFVSELADRVVAGRVDLLFRLYKAYLKLYGRNRHALTGGGDEDKGEVDTPVDFDSFRGWGETVLSDFNEIDMYGVNPDEIFKNVKDFREIASDFLTEEQRRVMEEYFGRPVGGGAAAAGFWRDFGDDESLSGIKRKFLHLWEVLAPLYRLLMEDLDSAGLATTGSLYRKALEAVRERGGEELAPHWRKIVLVGFNALSRVESEIFSALAACAPYDGPEGEEPAADYWWDSTGPVLRGELNSASRFVASNRRRFPEPEWGKPYIEMCDTDRMPAALRVVAAPSGTVQTKLIAEELMRMKRPDEVSDAHFRDARVAVVLPDESLLLPLLYSLPPDIGAVNLTMGYPLRLTSTVSFVNLLRRLQSRCRTVDGLQSYFVEDLSLILSHPYTHAVLGTEGVKRVRGEINAKRLRFVDTGTLEYLAPGAGALLRPLRRDAAPADVLRYLDSVMVTVDGAMSHGDGGLVKSRLDRAHISAYRDALARLGDAMEEHGVGMHFTSVFALTDRLLAGEQVSFEGEPLEGLQVMGMLETRALDFDRIIIPSLNEGILPMKARSRTFVPDTLRVAYGMPPANYRESLFAYYFYRMISRAEEVVMMYDARTGGGMRGGDISRYVLQLRYLYARDSLEVRERRFTIGKAGGVPQPVEKDAGVQALLNRFTLAVDGRNLSASSLQKYLDCPVRFYYECVVGLNADNPPERYIDNITQGDIVHDVMMRLYLPESGQRKLLRGGVTVTRGQVLGLLREPARIQLMLVRAINTLHFRRPADRAGMPLEGESAMVARQLEKQIRMLLERDLAMAPFRLYGVEVPGLLRYPTGDGREFNIKFAIDRIDGDMSGDVVRVVDYKTGSVHLEASDVEDVFAGRVSSKHIFQLMLYANLLNDFSGRGDKPVSMEIYRTGQKPADPPHLPRIGGDIVTHHLQPAGKAGETFNELFLGQFRGMIAEIFNPDVPFIPTSDTRGCDLCNLRALCSR